MHYIFFDTETTGLPKKWGEPETNFENYPRLVQLAWAVFNEKGNICAQSEYIIKPTGFEISEQASQVHGITTEIAKLKGVVIAEVLALFRLVVKTYSERGDIKIIAHNMDFDKSIINSECHRNDLLPIISSDLNLFCTMKSTTGLCKIRGNYGYKYPKLSELHERLFGCDFEGAHDAKADVEATAKCFFELKRRRLTA